MEARASSSLPWQLDLPRPSDTTSAAVPPPSLKEVFEGSVTVEWVFNDQQLQVFHHLVAQPFDWDDADSSPDSPALLATTSSRPPDAVPNSSDLIKMPASASSTPGISPRAPAGLLARSSATQSSGASDLSPWGGAAASSSGGASVAAGAGTAAQPLPSSPSTAVTVSVSRAPAQQQQQQQHDVQASQQHEHSRVAQEMEPWEDSCQPQPLHLLTEGSVESKVAEDAWAGFSPAPGPALPWSVGWTSPARNSGASGVGLGGSVWRGTDRGSPPRTLVATVTAVAAGLETVPVQAAAGGAAPMKTAALAALVAAPRTESPEASESGTASTAPVTSSNSSAADAVPSARSALSVLISEEEALALPPPPASFPDLPALQAPTIAEAQLSNGLKVLLLEDHEVPLVRGSLLLRGGKHASPPDKVGLASISMAVQRAGGSVAHPGPALDLRLEELAAAVEASAGPQALTVDFFSARDDMPEVLGLWAEVIRQPALPQDRLSLYQDQVLNALEHRDDEPTVTARRQLAMLMYGKDSIYARQPSRAGVLSVTVDDIKSFLAKWERPDAGVLGVVGDFEPAALLALLEKELGSWVPAPGQPATPPELVREVGLLAPYASSAGKVLVFDRPGLSQASVAVSEPGVSLLDPDAYALDLLATTLNSFGGQLFDQLRSREGLAYSVFGAWDTPPDRQGTFVGGGETSMPAEFILGLRRVLNDATRQAPMPAALGSAKDETLNGFVFNFASKSAQLQRTLVYDLLGLPRDLLFRYRDGVARATAEDVLGAAQRHLHPEQQVTVVVGDALQVLPQLEAAGLKPALTMLLDVDQ